jgi:hypothetical protein
MGETWACPGCGQKLPMAEPSCRICRITRDHRGVVGRIPQPARSAKPAEEPVEVPFPFTIKGARFNLPLPSGSLWTSGSVICVPEGLCLATEKDGIDPARFAAAVPAASGPVGPASLFLHRSQFRRVVHQKMIGDFIEMAGPQKIPLRLEPEGWKDLAVVCARIGIPRE